MEALPILERSLKSNDPSLPVEAAFTLLALDPSHKEALQTLLMVCTTAPAGAFPFFVLPSIGEEPYSILEGIGRLSPAARKNLLAAGAPLLQAPDPAKRRVALALATLDPDRVLPNLRDLMEAGNPREQAAAARFLGDMGSKAKPAFADLCRALRKKTANREPAWGEDWADDSGFALALARIDPEAAVPILVETWRGKSRNQPLPPAVQSWGRRALPGLGTPLAHPPESYCLVLPGAR